MPNRILRDYTNSEKVNKLSYEAEVFFVRLMMKADDYGRFYGNPKLLKSNLFPHRVDFIKDAQILKWKQECVSLGLVNQYSFNDKDYIEITDFRQRLRLMVSKFPVPPSNDGQMTVNGQSNDGVKRSRNEVEVETESEDEVETKATTPIPLKNDFPVQVHQKKIDSRNCESEKEKILSDQIYVEHNCMKNGLTEIQLKENFAAFINQNSAIHHFWENEQDLRKHFQHWLPKKLNLKNNGTERKLRPTSRPPSDGDFGKL
jgi:hypothetical protein